MGIHEVPTPKHWNYFLALEDDLVRMSRYLEPTTHNFDSYSLELARILFAASSEVDVVAKLLCKRLNRESRAGSIGQYRGELLVAYPQIVEAAVTIPRFGLTLTPWDPWSTETSPLWWQAYNKVKHQRDTHFAQASLKHALNSVAGLFVLLLLFYLEEGGRGELKPDPAIFRPLAPFVVDRHMWGAGGSVYRLEPRAGDWFAGKG